MKYGVLYFKWQAVKLRLVTLCSCGLAQNENKRLVTGILTCKRLYSKYYGVLYFELQVAAMRMFVYSVVHAVI